MKKKEKDKFIKEILKLKSGIIRDKVDEIFRTQPDNYYIAKEQHFFTIHQTIILFIHATIL
ncbi:MAG: hypothetical protein PF482_06745 [Desulfobacteraceae bacterium]|jgi:hypothetical protein|nr:hypothetical protein [Desulfobacteraceae bacterium]